MAKQSTEWKKIISHRLKTRNRHEYYEFSDLIDIQSKLFEQVASLKSKNVQLTLETERLKAENLSLQIRADSGGGGVSSNERTTQLEQKLYRLQEELTDLHKRKGENAQMIIDLTNAMKEKEKELQLKDSKLMDALAIENGLKTEIKHLEATVFELEATNQTLKDEHQALQMAFTALEEKNQKAQVENNELMARWLEYKMSEADKMNQENDRFFRHKQERLQRDLADAANEPVQIKTDPSDGYMKGIPPICLSASLPTKAQCKLDAHEGEVNAVLWSPTGSLFATGGSDRKIKLWEYHGGQCTCKGTLLGSNAGITALEFDFDEALILGASNDYASRLWSLSDQRLRHTLTGHSGKVLTAKFLGDSTKVVTGSHDRTLKIWDLHTRTTSKTIFAGSSCNDLVTLHASSIISGHFDKKLRFWDPRCDQTLNEISLQGRITSLALAPDRASLLVCTREDTLKCIDLRMNQVIYTLCAENFKVAFDYSRAVFSPDGSYAMAGSSDGTLYVWNIQKGKVERMLKEHTHAIVACSWHPSGSVILSSERQKKVILWSDI